MSRSLSTKSRLAEGQKPAPAKLVTVELRGTLTTRVGWLEAALRAIAGPCDSLPFIEVYRAAGGGYEGLQAIARLGLGDDT